MCKLYCGLSAFLLIALAAALVRADDPPPRDKALAAKVDKLFAKWDRPDSPGVALAVVKDGEIVHKRGYGMASLEYGVPITTSTLFLIASLSKHFTVFLILLLAQGGRLSLDDDVRKHVPELPNFGKTITVRHLIHHTSGLREELALQALLGRKFEDVMTRQDFLGWLRNQKELNFEPGERYTYCNTGYSLLGLIVERAAGKPVRAYADEKVFKPLGMKNTLFRDHYDLVIKNAATSYGPRPGGGFKHIPVPFEMPGATNLYTTVEDLALWDRNFYDAKVGGKALLEQMHRKGRLNNDKELDYAGGLHLGKYRGLNTVEHTGSHGGYRTILLRFPEQRFSVIALANAADFNSRPLARQVADLYLGSQFKAPPEAPKEVKVDPKVYDAYVGRYHSLPGVIFFFTRKGDHLFLTQPGAGTWRLYPTSETEFIAKEIPLRCRFVKAAAGQVEKVTGEIGPQEFAGRRLHRADLKPEQLAGYAGEFYSPELKTLYTVSVRDGKLRVRYPRGEVTLLAWQGDEFSSVPGSPFSTLRFTRNAGAEVHGFMVSSGRLHNLRFTRVELRPSP